MGSLKKERRPNLEASACVLHSEESEVQISPSLHINNPMHNEIAPFQSLTVSQSRKRILRVQHDSVRWSKGKFCLDKLLDLHSEEVMNSRLLVAAWPNAKNVPDVVVAIDFSSPEEATKFSTPLNLFLSKVLPPVEETPETKTEGGPTKPAAKTSKPN